jgi:hypothetical protein
MKEFFAVKKYLIAVLPPDDAAIAAKLRIKDCPLIEKTRLDPSDPDNKRACAHVGHAHESTLICVWGKFHTLTRANKIGVLLHEAGHILSGSGDEMEADKYIFNKTGIGIGYNNKNEIQEISAADIKEVCGG